MCACVCVCMNVLLRLFGSLGVVIDAKLCLLQITNLAVGEVKSVFCDILGFVG